MSSYNHTPVVIGANANASVVNSPLGQLDATLGQVSALNTTNKVVANAINEVYALITGVTGGASVTANQLIAWTEAEAYQLTSIVYSPTYTNTVNTGTVLWPDGSAGAWTTILINTTWEAIDTYSITHTDSGKTVTQPTVTRNAAGNVTIKPVLVVS